MDVQKTALYDYHKNLGAKFVSFAGYEMPIQYSDGIIKEHISTRTFAGFFDVSHMGQFYISGANLEGALEKIIPVDLKNLKVNQSKYSFLLNDNGGIIDDLIITRREKSFCIILNAACKENDIKQISKYLDNTNHKFHLCTQTSLIALQGPKSAEILEKYIKGISDLKFMQGDTFVFDGEKIYVTRSGYTGEDGFEMSVLNTQVEKLIKNLVEDKVKPIGLGARDTLRLEAGLCLYGQELNEEITPIEANLKWAITKKRREEGGFNGWKKIKESIDKGTSKIRVGVLPEGKIIAREGTKILSSEEKEIGTITSGTFGPSINAPIAMGYINSNFSKIGTVVKLEVRGKKYEAKIAELPFYKKSYAK